MSQSRRKLYFVILGIAALGLIVDRFVLTGSATAPASASALSGSQPRDPGNASSVDMAPSASIPEIPFPTGLRVQDEQTPFLDLFARPDARFRAASGTGRSYNGRSYNPGNSANERLAHDAFERRHTLDGVLIQQRLKMAVLEGRPVKIGDAINGCTLNDVSGYRAIFECDDGPAVLIVKDTGTRAPG